MVALGVARRTPLKCRREARATTATQPRDVDLLNHVLLRHTRGKDLGNCRVSLVRQIVVDALGVNYAAVAQRNARLLGQKLVFIGRNEQLVHQREVVGNHRVVNGLHVLFLNLYQTVQLALVVVHVHDGLQKAHAVAARNAKLDIRGVVLGNKLLKLGVNAAGTGSDATASFSDYDSHACSSPSLLAAAMERITLRALSGVSLP